MKEQTQREEERFEEFCREVVRAARADEEAINAAADSPFLFNRVRVHLAATPERRTRDGFFAALFGGRLQRWTMAATVVAAVITIAALMRWPGETPSPPDYRSVATVEVGPVPIATTNRQPDAVGVKSEIKPMRNAGLRHRASATAAREVTTEYMPLTYVANADEADSGHVVRVQVPRTALLALGVSLNAEPSAELVKADVIVGDDGLARAIRLVR